MKKANKNLLLLYCVLLSLIAGIIFVFVYIPPTKDPQGDVVVSYKKPDSFDPVKSSRFDATPVETASPTPIATFTPLLIASVADPKNGRQWMVKIQDPLGDPIPAGTVAFGSECMSFTSGGIVFPATAPQDLTVRVSAEGYAPGEFTVTPNASTIVLDYLCDFSIQVRDGRGNPVPNTTIRVWKSNSPPRPLGNQVKLNDWNGNSYCLRRDEYECRVIEVSEPSSQSAAMGSPHGVVYPKIGDVVTALGTVPWKVGYSPLYLHQQPVLPGGDFNPLAIQRSSRLRIWDSLCLAEATSSNQAGRFEISEVLEISRGNQFRYYDLKFPKCPEDQPPIYEVKTNDKGEWTLRGVPPALYYVQALGEKNLSSAVVTLYPACGGTPLFLYGEGILWVYVEKKGIPAKDILFARVPDAEVTLHSQAGLGLYSKKSDDVGEARFDRLPCGEYRLTAKAQGQTAEKNVTVNGSMGTCVITLPHEELHTVTGIVLEQESGAPVEGYPLELNTASRSGSLGLRVYQKTSSDTNGRFAFHDVLPGEYCVSEDLTSPCELKYAFSEPSLAYGPFFHESYTHLSRIDMNVNEDLHDVTVLVKPVIKTSFSGIVVNQDGTPAANAVFTVSTDSSARKATLCPENVRTDANGLFSFTLSSIDKEKVIYEYVITAMSGCMADSRWVPRIDNPMKFDFVEEQFQSTSSGSILVKGNMGDRFDDLRIVVEPISSDKILVGKLVVEGEERFSGLDITATQHNQDVFIQKNKEGYFKSENISAGNLLLSIFPGIRASIATPEGHHEFFKYLSRRVNIQIEENQPETYVEIPLQHTGYYWGYVKDSDGSPLPGVLVWAINKFDSDGYRCFSTNQNGFFFIDSVSVSEGMDCDIKLQIGDQVKIFPKVPINTGNLQLQ